MSDNTMRVDLVSAEKAVWSGPAKQVIAKTVEGEIGILANHEPLLAILATGEVRITLPDGERILANAEDGFLSVEKNVVRIVARHAALV